MKRTFTTKKVEDIEDALALYFEVTGEDRWVPDLPWYTHRGKLFMADISDSHTDMPALHIFSERRFLKEAKLALDVYEKGDVDHAVEILFCIEKETIDQ